MTPEEQRIAIAGACGNKWTLATKGPGYCMWVDSLPDYLSDLNAMNEAERILPSGKWDRYTQYLGAFKGTRRFVVAHSSAAERAEAFLRTLGKWEES